MRYLAAFVVILALLSVEALRAQIKTEVVESTGETRLVSKSLRSLVSSDYPGHGSFRAEYEVETKQDTTWRLSLFGFARDTTQMSRTRRFRFSADGDTIESRNISSSTRSLKNRIVEVKHVRLSRGDFRQLAMADDVQALVGPFRFTLTRPLREDLRRILRQVSATQETQPVASEDSASGQ